MSYKELDDIELMELFQKGDKSAFDVLYLRHQKKIYGLIMSKINNIETSEELTQETFVKVLKNNRFRAKLKFSIDNPSKFQDDLDNEIFSGDLQQEFDNKGISFSERPIVLIREKGIKWLIKGIIKEKVNMSSRKKRKS